MKIRKCVSLVMFGIITDYVSAFLMSLPPTNGQQHRSKIELQALKKPSIHESIIKGGIVTLLTVSFCLTSPIPAFADEYGREIEAPTLFTGETVLICTKRGPLGACLKTEARTADNDNDKSNKYMKSVEAESVVKAREQALRAAATQEAGSDLLTRLQQQTLDNKEKNDRLVKQKTLMNDQAASFGPFDRQTVILNASGEGFTLLENPQAMRLKKQGYINNNRQFITQPSKEVLDAALEPSENEGFAGLAKSIFGGGQ